MAWPPISSDMSRLEPRCAEEETLGHAMRDAEVKVKMDDMKASSQTKHMMEAHDMLAKLSLHRETTTTQNPFFRLAPETRNMIYELYYEPLKDIYRNGCRLVYFKTGGLDLDHPFERDQYVFKRGRALHLVDKAFNMEAAPWFYREIWPHDYTARTFARFLSLKACYERYILTWRPNAVISMPTCRIYIRDYVIYQKVSGPVIHKLVTLGFLTEQQTERFKLRPERAKIVNTPYHNSLYFDSMDAEGKSIFVQYARKKDKEALLITGNLGMVDWTTPITSNSGGRYLIQRESTQRPRTLFIGETGSGGASTGAVNR